MSRNRGQSSPAQGLPSPPRGPRRPVRQDLAWASILTLSALGALFLGLGLHFIPSSVWSWRGSSVQSQSSVPLLGVLNRLEVAIERFSLVSSSSMLNEGGLKRIEPSQIASALRAEVKNCLDTLVKDAKMGVELSSYLFRAMQSLHVTLYSTIKLSLHPSRGNATVLTTKQAAEAVAVKEFALYGIVQELLRFAPEPSDTKEGVYEYKHPFVRLNLQAAGGAFNLPPLATAIKYRFYRLVSTLSGMGGSTDGALDAAVLAGDDISVAIILHTARRLNPAVFSPLADQASRLYGVKSLIARRLALAAQGDRSGAVAMPPENAFLRIEGQGHAETSKTTRGTDEVRGGGGFMDLGLQITGALGAVESPGSPPTPLPASQCHVARISAASSSTLVQELRAMVQSGQPFVVQGDEYISLLQGRWTRARLGAAKKEELNVSSIPYGGIFGKQVSSVTLKSFLSKSGGQEKKQQAESCLRCSTERLRQALAQIDSAPIVDISDPAVVERLLPGLNPPLYSFGGSAPRAVEEERNWLLGGAKTNTRTEGRFLRRLIHELKSVTTSASGTSTTSRDNSSSEDEGMVGDVQFQWFLGGPLTGAPFHNHQWAVNGLVHGRKLWLLLPPGRDVYSTLHPILFAASGGVSRPDWPYPLVRPLAGEALNAPCTYEQRSGEVLIIPRHVSHAVLNLAETVGFAVEGL